MTLESKTVYGYAGILFNKGKSQNTKYYIIIIYSDALYQLQTTQLVTELDLDLQYNEKFL